MMKRIRMRIGFFLVKLLQKCTGLGPGLFRAKRTKGAWHFLKSLIQPCSWPMKPWGSIRMVPRSNLSILGTILGHGIGYMYFCPGCKSIENGQTRSIPPPFHLQLLSTFFFPEIFLPDCYTMLVDQFGSLFLEEKAFSVVLYTPQGQVRRLHSILCLREKIIPMLGT